MINLYNELKYNVDKINNHYKNGFTFHDNSSWKAPYDGSVSVSGIGKSEYARNYALNTSWDFMASDFGIADFDTYLYMDHIDGQWQSQIHYYYNVVEKTTTVKKDSEYKINFNASSWYEPAIAFGGVILAYCSYYYAFNALTASPPLPYNNVFSVGSVYRIEAKYKTNPSSLGDCEVQVVNYYDEQNADGSGTHKCVTFKIINILRQPSESKITSPFLTVKYTTDIIKNIENGYNL